ncbi:MAG: hypothetical protein WBG96_15010, partial [Thermoanaerobaculia bacterium]
MKLLAGPSAIPGWSSDDPPYLPSLLAFRRLIEQLEAFLRVNRRRRLLMREHLDRSALRDPHDVVTLRNPILIGDSLRNGDLSLAGNLAHILTISRKISVSYQGKDAKGSNEVQEGNRG